MIRAGLFLYDHLGGRGTLPTSFGVDLHASRWGAGLKDKFGRGFVYSDARVDDARLVVANALSAKELGAEVRIRARVADARRDNGLWRIAVAETDGASSEIAARALVNATGPWVKQVLDVLRLTRGRENVRHIKGSHIIVPRVHAERHAYILQNSDQRIVFVIPYQESFSLIGTTDVPVDEYEKPAASREEIDYLCDIANAYLATPIGIRDVVSSYSGVRPLYDDGSQNPSAVTRDYVLKLDGAAPGEAPLLSIFGGKITTYRRLAEAALAELKPFFPQMKREWTRDAPLPGGELPGGGLAEFERELAARYSEMPSALRTALVHRHGARTPGVLGEAKSAHDLGTHFGDTLYAAEVDYLVAVEWARSAEDVLWRRTKCGLHLSREQCDSVTAYLHEQYGAARPDSSGRKQSTTGPDSSGRVV